MSDLVLPRPQASARRHALPRVRLAGVPRRILVAGSLAIAFVIGLAALQLGLGAPAVMTLLPVIAAASAAIALTIAARESSGMDRTVRGWVAVAAWCWSLGHGVRALAGTSDRLDGGPIANVLWIAGFVAATGFVVVVSRRLDSARGRSLTLDAVAVTGATILGVLVVVGDRTVNAEAIDAALAILLPALTLSALGLVVVAAFARRWRWSLTGAAPSMLGLLILGLGWIGTQGSGPVGTIALDPRWAMSQAIGWLLLAHGVTTFRDADRAGLVVRRIAPILQASIPALAVLFVAIAATFDEAFLAEGLWPVAVIFVALTLGAVIIRQALTTRDREHSIGRMSRTVRAVAIERRQAETARAAERERADMASLILAVSEDLRHPDAQASYETALRRIAPAGCRASIARLDDGQTRFARIATIGPGSAGDDCTCLVTTMPGDIGDLLHGRVVGRRQDDAPPGAGIVRAVTPESVLRGPVRSSLTVPIRRSDGWLLGAIHFEDLECDRIHAPAFVALARSTANQLAGAIDNVALLERLREEIAERDRIQAELIQASKSKAVGELAGAVAHEVNNPLTGILGYAEVLLDDLSAADPHRGDLEVIRDEAIRARSIVRALVDLARIRTGTRTVASLGDVARAAARETRPRALAAGIALTATYEAVPPVAVDGSAMGAVVAALVDNAIAAMPDGGALRLEATAEPDRAVLKVIDTGCGMEPDVVRRAFDPFFSTHDARSGRGMGLTIALGVVRDHGGSIWIESRPGEGTTVEIRLPIAASPVAEPDPMTAPEPVRARAPG